MSATTGWQHDLAAMRARLTPEREALWFAGRWYRYAELDARAARVAGALHARGVGFGDRVAILAHNHIAHFDLMLAAPKLGFIPTPFNTRLSSAEQVGLCDYTAPCLLLHDEANAGPARACEVPRLALDRYEDMLAAAAPRHRPEREIADDDVALILFTGGSTGLPKGAMIPYRQQLANAVNTIVAWELRDSDCVIQATPCFHAAVNALATPLLHAGGRVVVQDSFEPGAYLEAVARHRASLLFMVPTMFQMLAEHAAFARSDFSSVRWAISGGAPCPEPVRTPFVEQGIRFKQGYGMTEAGVNCFSIGLDEAEARPGSVGKPMPHAQAVIRHADGTPVELGETGELTLAGPHVCLGYYQRPEATAESFRDGWLWTGDLARQDADGFFTITGRRKEMFISGGENVYPAEVEAAIYDQPEIAECAVLGVADERWGEVGLAAVVLREGRTLSADELRQRLKTCLAGYKVPRRYHFLPSLPKSGAGKILKPAIAEMWARESAEVSV